MDCPIVLTAIPFGRKLNGLPKIILGVFYKNVSFFRFFHLKILNGRHFVTDIDSNVYFFQTMYLHAEFLAKFQLDWSSSYRDINYLIKQTKWWIAGKRSVSPHVCLYELFSLFWPFIPPPEISPRITDTLCILNWKNN